MDATRWTGDPVEDIETAKRLIAEYPAIDAEALAATASGRAEPLSARVAAIYVLGMCDVRASHPMLTRIATDPAEPPEVRDHATEAIAPSIPSG